MRRELETDPDPDVRRLEAELRASASAPRRGTNKQDQPSGQHHTAPVPADSIDPAGGGFGDHPLPDVLSPSRPGDDVPCAGHGAMLLSSCTAAFARQLGWFLPASASPTFAVGLIREDDVPDSLRQGRVLTDMVATNLARVDGPRVLANSRLLELMRPVARFSGRLLRRGAASRRQRAGSRASCVRACPTVLTLELGAWSCDRGS